MKVLVIGGGGREHALAWKLAQSPRVQSVTVAPGNGGTAADPALRNLPLTGIDELADFAEREKIALTVVGPEAPLAAGVVDRFRARGLRIFGPTQAAARLESSKDFAKSFKADGLAAGKGVVVAETAADAHAAIDDMLGANTLGVQHVGGRARVVIEEFMAGEEASFIVVSDGRNVVSLATSQDHKRVGDGDTGPNTGGMGAVSPAPVVTPNVHARVMHEIIQPTIAGMARDGTPFTGFLYAGLMIDAAGHPRTVEFNCRLGDPEAQPILMRLKSDLLDLLLHATDGTLDQVQLQWDRRIALGVVIAAHGYPGGVRRGDPIDGLPADAEDLKVFHAGTSLEDGRLVASGGRVLCVTALGESARVAQQRAYEGVAAVRLDGAVFRRDIGHRAIKAR
jgi:phosphoribosylamine--glycine ligase